MKKAAITTLALFSAAWIFYVCESGLADKGNRPTPYQTTLISAADTTGCCINFIAAAKAVTPAVVHIKLIYPASSAPDDILEQLYRSAESAQPVAASGSGVIISSDGYIATC